MIFIMMHSAFQLLRADHDFDMVVFMLHQLIEPLLHDVVDMNATRHHGFQLLESTYPMISSFLSTISVSTYLSRTHRQSL